MDDIQVGDLVNVPGGMYGTIKFLGSVAGKPGRFAGVELALEHSGRGKNNGEVDGRHYFTTSVPGSGIFVPINNSKYVTKRAALTPQTPARPAPSANFSRSVGPGLNPSATINRPKFRRPSLPRAESPKSSAQPPPRLNLTGLRTPSAFSKGSPVNGVPRTPHRQARPASRPASRISMDRSTTPTSVKRSDIVRTPAFEDPDSMERIRLLEKQLRDRDKQLEDQASTLSEFQQSITELEGLDALQVRAQLREKNERITTLTAEFDSHRADFRSTLDTLEVAASETERVYEKRIEELMLANRELQSRGEDVETVAIQLKQLEELVSELEEGLEDARRGEAEARGEVEFLRGEVERTRLELKQEREKSAASYKENGVTMLDGSNRHQPTARDLDQKDDEIRGLKAIIHSLSRGYPPSSQAFLQQNGMPHDPDHDEHEQVLKLESRLQELETAAERKNLRIEELQRELDQSNEPPRRNRSGTITTSPLRVNKNPPLPPPPAPVGDRSSPHTSNHAHTLSDRTVVPTDWNDSPNANNGGGAPYSSFSSQRGIPNDTNRRLATMPESDTQSSSTDDGSAGWCEICETSGHDILTCTNMFGSGAATTTHSKPSVDSAGYQPTPTSSNHLQTHDDLSAGSNGYKSPITETNGFNSYTNTNTNNQRTGRDAVLEGLRGIGGLSSSSMAPVAGKASAIIDETKWCALCERDGHESIDCPFDE
ncbi:hypothetical protein FQN57_006121 [Myotisia sp. PD_48]|nr:hypothetical protein FQN57_006121 [Myotisia sp. PD_48]